MKLGVISLGCDKATVDSERLVGELVGHGAIVTPDLPGADVILVNTCAIREKAEDKVYSKLGQLKQLKATRPDLVIGVMGEISPQKGAHIVKEALQIIERDGTDARVVVRVRSL